MTTVREYLQSIQAQALSLSARSGFSGQGMYDTAASAIEALDESETAWRESGDTYRLVPDDIEVPS